MANTAGNAYALTTLCPIKNGLCDDKKVSEEYQRAFDKITLTRIQRLNEHQGSPFANIPNTWFARLFILNDVFFQQGNNVYEDHLQSKYIVFTSNFHGDLDAWLKGMWQYEEQSVRHIWQHAVAFDSVKNADDFVAYIKKCQITTTLFFNGSDDSSLQTQLKALYTKQLFSEFVLRNQGLPTNILRTNFEQFLQKIQLSNELEPSWQPAQTHLSSPL